MNSDNSKFTWYAEGLHFECLKCGRCCSGPAEGYIWVSRPEIKLIARHLNMPAGEVKQKFLKRVGFRITIIEDIHTRDCIFLRDNQGRKECMIYSVRPGQCRNWPFWPTNLANPENWNNATRKCPGINRGRVYSPDEIQTIKDNDKWWQTCLGEGQAVAGLIRRKEIVDRVSDIYKWLDEEMSAQSVAAGSCDICGKCCDFDTFGHRLFVTTPEMIYLADKLGEQNFKPMTTDRCSYQVDGKCTIHPLRFAGCRIFCCKGNPDFQSELTEATIKKFKHLCEKFGVPYRYVDLPTALQVKNDSPASRPS